MNSTKIRTAIIIAKDDKADVVELTEARHNLWEAARNGRLREDKEPRSEYLDLICEIQSNAASDGMCHVGDSSGWCIRGDELERALASLHQKRQESDSIFL